jgi:EAL domain-containing protein (putative c-di-GMP-specific phosphodiesterase class I)
MGAVKGPLARLRQTACPDRVGVGAGPVGRRDQPYELIDSILSTASARLSRVIAEGVEEEEQARQLQLLRCDHFQGYLVSRRQYRSMR